MNAPTPLNRPAEYGGLLGTASIALAHGVFHVNDPTTLTYVAGVFGALPSAITFMVNHGGLAGMFRLVFKGKAKV